MAAYELDNLSVFVINDAGAFVPVASYENMEIDTVDFDDGVWAIFRSSDGMVNRLFGDLDLWEGGEENIFDQNSLKLWRDMGGAPSAFAGTYVVIGLKYYSAHQSDIEFTFDLSLAGGGYVAVEAAFDTLDVDREVFWAFSDYSPVIPEPSDFWTGFIASREIV